MIDPDVLDPDVLDPAVVASLQRLGERTGRDIFTELTELFLSTGQTQLVAARSALEAGQDAEVARIAHALKGSSSVIGGRRVAAAAAELEQVVGERECAPPAESPPAPAAPVRTALAACEAELARLRAALAGSD